ncbi:hypothetical protein SAMN02910298_01122 [Pseudobutyrivibrio sp. YE44]|uniref:CPBP family intramembrane glutamic endopeptidase n=1 Tax=Pseudobutyrivibrio sp. YE44 TaxID=1520802 RepID=UPI000890B60E|nr:CPBP family intramembrane glutamic endopeptidase [Pseudobutyrivibrio sp. YE44]SDB23038.1 hypothetical protein SAMN02910298_01122 [Pseudobutyrivibrio sp. YE44]
MNQTNTDRRKHIPWIFLPTVLAMVIQTAVAIIVMQLVMVREFSITTKSDYADFMLDVVHKYSSADCIAVVSLMYALVTAILMLVIFRNTYRDGKLAGLKMQVNNWGIMILGMVLFIVSMQYVTVYLMNALASAFPAWLEEYQALTEAAGLDAEHISPIMIAYAVLLGPICEEFIFRGVTFFAARKVMPIHFAILVQAILFGAFHMNKLQGVYAFVLGLGLGYIMYLYDNLIVTIVIHMAYNMIGVMDLPAGGDNLITFFLCSLASLVVAYISIILLRNSSSVVKDGQFFSDI